jgi:eukaryotic-like serine/threonine-protein kinase
MIYQGRGKYEESVREDTILLGMDADFVPGYINLAYDYILLDRLPEAETTLQKAAERKLEVPDILILEYELAVLKGDHAGVDNAVARAQGTSGAEDWIAAEQAFVAADYGDLAKARSLLDRAVQLAQGPALRERAAQYKAGGAVLEALVGNAREAKQKSTEALALSKGRDTEYGAALALALSMDSAGAQKLTDELEKRFPEDTFVKLTYSPVLRARLALNHGDPAKAIEALRPNEPIELGFPSSAQFGIFGALYPIYMRGEAYLALHRSAGGISKDFEPPWHRFQRPDRTARPLEPGPGVRIARRRQHEGESRLSGFPKPLEIRRRP